MSSLGGDNTVISNAPHFIHGPTTRGTLNIVWACLSILVLCTWSILHPNVPTQFTSHDRRNSLTRATQRMLHKIWWMSFSLLAPEWTFSKALVDFWSVHTLKELNEQALKDHVPWSKSHTYFANMGGFGIKFQEPGQLIDDVEDLRNPSMVSWEKYMKTELKKRPNALLRRVAEKHLKRLSEKTVDARIDEQNSQLAVYASDNINGTWLTEDWQRTRCECPDILLPNLAWLRTNLWVVDAYQLLVARQLGIIEQLPHVNPNDLDDRNKGDFAVRLITILQICWFIVALSFRLSKGIATSQLEVMTLAFSVSSVASYLLLYSKPKDVQHTIVIEANKRPSTPAEMVQIAVVGPWYCFYSWTRYTPWLPDSALPLVKGRYIPEQILLTLGSSIILVGFGALHCLGWNFVYPSKAEQSMWQASSIITATALPTLTLFGTPATIVQENSDWHFVTKFAFTIARVIMCLFVLARVFILVEVFRSLAFLPPGAFIATGIDNIPHIG